MASSKITLISSGIHSIVSAATGWEKVYEGQRLQLDWASFLAQFKDTSDDIRGATISYGPYTEDPLDTMENLLGHGFVIRCILGEGNDTERAFRAAMEQIVGTLRNVPTSGVWERLHNVSMTEFQSRLIHNVLCHYTEIRFTVDERVARNSEPPDWTQLTLWHRFEAHAGAPGGGLFNVRADLTTAYDMTAAALRLEFPEWQVHGAAEMGMMPDPDADGTDTLARGGRLWVDGEMGAVQADVVLVGMKDAFGVPSDDQETGISLQMAVTDTAWVQTIYTPANLTGTTSATEPPAPEGGGES